MNPKFSLMSAIGMAALMAAEPGAAGGAAAPAAAGAAPTSNDPALAAATEAKKRAPKDPANTLNIINGRLPLPLVYMIRFKEAGVSNATVAKKYGTSVGKVFDINKGRNFGYIDSTYKPSAEEMAAAKAWCETGKTAKGQSLSEAGGDPTAILKGLSEMTVATPDEVAKRAWQIREVGKKAAPAGEAPVAGSTPSASAVKAVKAATNAPAAGKTEAKLF